MLKAQSIILAAQSECGTVLSKQAIAVINAICAAENSQVLELQATNEDLQKQINAVKLTPTGRMKKPTRDEVRSHGKTIGFPEPECDTFFDYYESNGWKVNNTAMKLWTAAMSNWKRRWLQKGGKPIEINGHPKRRDVDKICSEKWGDDLRWQNWATSFYSTWSKREWKRGGRPIDWKIELSNQVAIWKTK